MKSVIFVLVIGVIVLSSATVLGKSRVHEAAHKAIVDNISWDEDMMIDIGETLGEIWVGDINELDLQVEAISLDEQKNLSILRLYAEFACGLKGDPLALFGSCEIDLIAPDWQVEAVRYCHCSY